MASKSKTKNNLPQSETNLTNEVSKVEVNPLPNEISKEEKAARITAKQAITAALITAAFGAVSAISVAIINKPPVSNSNEKAANQSIERKDAEIQYYQPSIDESIKQLDDNKIKLTKCQNEIENLISKETDSKRIAQLQELAEKIKAALETNEKVRVDFNEYANKSIEALHKGNGVEAAVLRKQANERIENEFEAILEIAKAIEEFNQEMANLSVESSKISNASKTKKPENNNSIKQPFKPTLRGIRNGGIKNSNKPITPDCVFNGNC